MSSIRASSRGRWCFHVRRVLLMHWSGESWLVESGRMDNRSRGGLKVLCSRGGLLSPTLTRSGEDHGYIRMDKYLHWYEAFWGKAQKQIHEGLGPKWTISYHCGDMWCPGSFTCWHSTSLWNSAQHVSRGRGVVQVCVSYRGRACPGRPLGGPSRLTLGSLPAIIFLC